MTLTTLDLLRHGEVAGGLCLGSNHDLPTSPTGLADMRGWIEEADTWQGVISSPLVRCEQFANELCNQHDLPLLLDSDWRELGFGEWEGRSWQELYDEEGDRLIEFWRNPQQHPAPSGEDFTKFQRRIDAAWDRAQQRAAGQHWLIVTHAGPIRALLCHVLGIPNTRISQLEVPLAGLTRLELWDDNPPRLLFPGRTA